VQGLLVIALCNLVTIITAISMSAVSTNGQIKAGGTKRRKKEAGFKNQLPGLKLVPRVETEGRF
jgi:hypothetical protein